MDGLRKISLMDFRGIVFVFAFLLIAFFLNGQNIPGAAQSGPWHSGSYEGAGVSLYAKNLKTGQVLLDFNRKLTLVPASSLKTITTATAIEILPVKDVFQTTLALHGHVENGTLHGNIVIYGNGDPALGSRYSEMPAEALLSRWTDKLQEAGIRRIAGGVIIDVSCCSNQMVPDTWPWYDIGNYYASGAGCINWRDNSYNLNFDRRSVAAGTEVVITGTDPYVPNLHHEHHVIASGNRDLAYIYGAPGQFKRIVRGSIPAGSGTFTIRGSLPDPAMQLAFELHQAIINCGIQIEKPFEVHTNPVSQQQTKVLDRLNGTDVAVYYERIMSESDNLYAEGILNRIARQLNADCDPKKSAEAMFNFWKSKSLQDIDRNFILDGSGLSPRNGVSSAFLVNVLEWMYKNSNNYNTFLSSFPVAGRDGTVSNWMRNTPAGNMVHVKSGSMSRVQSYTGYVVQSNGSVIAFSFIANNFTGFNTPVRRDMEALLLSLIE